MTIYIKASYYVDTENDLPTNAKAISYAVIMCV